MPADRRKNTMRRIMNMVGFAADLAKGIVLVIIGVGVIIGGATGALWY
jgi:hypothetical protein